MSGVGGSERETKKYTLNYREQTDGYQRGGGLRDEENGGWGLKSILTMMKNKVK